MSDTGQPPAAPEQPPQVPPAAPPPLPRNGCLTAVMVLAGIVLLLPGLCTLLLFGNGGGSDPSIGAIASITFLVALLGVFLIVMAVRGTRR
jgi:hypothetical protein